MKRKTTDVVEILEALDDSDVQAKERIEEKTLYARLAQKIYEVRTARGLSQQKLAEMLGTKQPVIARLEDGDYDGHSIKTLMRIAKALNLEFFCDLREKQSV